LKLFVFGRKWVKRGSRYAIKDQNPYTEEVFVEVPAATNEDVDNAFDIAVKAQKGNNSITSHDLAQPILEGINIMFSNLNDITKLIVTESGISITKTLKLTIQAWP